MLQVQPQHLNQPTAHSIDTTMVLLRTPVPTILICTTQLTLIVSTAKTASSSAVDTDAAFNNNHHQYKDYISLEEDEVNEEELIHIPLRSRASVLRERHLTDANLDEDANVVFQRWAATNGYYIHDKMGENDDDTTISTAHDATSNNNNNNNNQNKQNHNNQRKLQEFSGEGTHFIDAYIGSPAQRRVLAVSSGADFTAFPCEGCSQCGTMISPYLQTTSSSFTTMPCGRCVGGQRDDVCDNSREKCIARGFNLVDKSAWTAYEARDYFYVGGAEAELASLGLVDPTGTDAPERYGFPLVFACQTEATGWYSSQVQDGIMGFSTARTSFVNQMVFQDKLKYPRFSMCFEQKILRESDVSSAGVVTLGGYNPKILDAPMVYVQNMEKEGETRYKVFVRNVYFRQGGGQSIVPDRDGQAVVKLNFDADQFNAKNGGTILDSGVPLVIFDESIQKSFKAEWKKLVGTDFSFGKVMLTEEDVLALPTLIIQIMVRAGARRCALYCYCPCTLDSPHCSFTGTRWS